VSTKDDPTGDSGAGSKAPDVFDGPPVPATELYLLGHLVATIVLLVVTAAVAWLVLFPGAADAGHDGAAHAHSAGPP
jgi:hypothetical protein